MSESRAPTFLPTNLFASQLPTQRPKVEFEVMATADSPAQPIAAFIDDWDAPLESGEHAYAQGRLALDIQPVNSAISYGLAWRYDYLMEFSEETAEVYWQYENKQNPTASKSYPLFLEAKHNERVGANIGFTQSIAPGWQLTTQANIWQGLHALDGKVIGNLSNRVLADSELNNIRDTIDKADAYLDYYYDEPALGEENLGWNPAEPSGYGYSIDLNLTGNLSEKTQLNIRGYDVLGRMRWKEMPRTRYALDYDVNGRPLYSLEGQLETKDVTQTLPWRVEGSLMHQLDNNWQLGAHGQVNEVQDLYQLSAGYLLNNHRYPFMLTALVEPQTRALGLSLDSRYGGVKVLTDDLDSEKAKRSEISLYGRYAW
ncbi:hypothetical protein ACS8FD_04595 [Psychrobacter sp. 1U2]|uniref:hypothetical protein n=1 Tax=Psychrobacter sp. 1U2 TaxID=3453577 RepID=UPI003F48A542